MIYAQIMRDTHNDTSSYRAGALAADLWFAGIIFRLVIAFMIPYKTDLGTSCRVGVTVFANLRIMCKAHSYFISIVISSRQIKRQI